MTQITNPYIFGEALFDCFPDGEQLLGGAPFNVAWHLQALGDAPQFISRVGQDALGDTIQTEMQAWGMTCQFLQQDKLHPTGRVNVSIKDNEPSYDIARPSAWDFIEYEQVLPAPVSGLLYHGTLAVRNDTSHNTLKRLTEQGQLDIFVDVNLRSPWWQKEDVFHWLEQARWVKLNQHEMAELGFRCADLHQDMTRMHTHFHLEQLIVTCGEKGAIVRDNEGEFHLVRPKATTSVVDTVGAGDAFTAMYIHALLNGWTTTHALERAQAFASVVVSQQGAIIKDEEIYRNILSL